MSISQDQIAAFRAAYEADPKNELATNAVVNAGMVKALYSRNDGAVTAVHEYSDKLETEGKITSQKASGRCWLFAGLNVMRQGMMKKYKLESDFELSQSYMFFWDKLEKCNYFLENIIDTRDEPLDGRLVQHLLSDPISDGGQWDMFVNLINKYGVCPKSAYPESHQSGASRPFCWLITVKLREYATKLRAAAAGEDLGQMKETMLAEIYRILSITLGAPPTKFDWAFRNKDKEFTRYTDLTPLAFYKEHVPFDVNQTVSLVNDPRNEYNRLMTVDRLGNVSGGAPVRYINVPIDVLKKYTIETIRDQEPVWFGCDVGKFLHRDTGFMDLAQFKYDLVYGTSFGMSKKERLQYGESLMTHAMVFTGVDVADDGTLIKARVENSWSEDLGQKGWFAATGGWLDEYLYQVVIDRKRIPAELLAILEQDPIVLPAWDPMGSLA